MKDDGGNAFPAAWSAGESGEYWTEYSSGMTLRDYFAAKSLQSIIAMLDLLTTKDGSPVNESKLAEQAYLFADAMLKERNK